MEDAGTIAGSCHCGAVRFEISRPEWVISCNCSICRRYATLWAHCPPNEGRLLAGEAATRAYVWGDRMIAFHFCATCGVTTHYTGTDGGRVSFNLRLADDPAAVADLRVRHFDGAGSWAFLD